MSHATCVQHALLHRPRGAEPGRDGQPWLHHGLRLLVAGSDLVHAGAYRRRSQALCCCRHLLHVRMLTLLFLPPSCLSMQLSGTPPFKGRRDREVLQAVRRGKYTLSGPKWDNVSEEGACIIERDSVLRVFSLCSPFSSFRAVKTLHTQSHRSRSPHWAAQPRISSATCWCTTPPSA